MSNVEAKASKVDDNALNILFREARTQNKWTSERVSDELLHEIFDLAKLGPTSANASPARFVFLRTPESKERLLPALSPNNVEKTKTAPVTVLIAYDLDFHHHLPKLFPHADAKAWFEGNESLIHDTAYRNSSLQGAYLMIAARALGVDCGPMSGFDQAKVNAEFFPHGKWKINFICNLGHGDPVGIFPRSPRLDFDEACELL